MRHQLNHLTQADPSESAKAMTRLNAICEGALRILSNAPQADVEVESLYEGCDLRLRVCVCVCKCVCVCTCVCV